MRKNEKLKKEKKEKNMSENEEKRKTNDETWIHTQNLRLFSGFTVVVVTLFRQNPLPCFCFGMCLVPEENQ